MHLFGSLRKRGLVEVTGKSFDRLFTLINLEVGLIVGFLLILAGTAAWGWGLEFWRAQHFGALNPERTLRIAIPGVLLFTLGFQIVLSSFFLSVMGMSRR